MPHAPGQFVCRGVDTPVWHIRCYRSPSPLFILTSALDANRITDAGRRTREDCHSADGRM
ncbi:hypothetical protein RRSWK_04593 [Rhodopirellula sp. SWK7]|nr:hypothetical protein RRSWK_04593 [Rhodopirellula sp. SWK7]